MWVVTELLCENLLSQTGHRKGFSPECVLAWAVKLAAWLNAFEHAWHLRWKIENKERIIHYKYIQKGKLLRSSRKCKSWVFIRYIHVLSFRESNHPQTIFKSPSDYVFAINFFFDDIVRIQFRTDQILKLIDQVAFEWLRIKKCWISFFSINDILRTDRRILMNLFFCSSRGLDLT